MKTHTHKIPHPSHRNPTSAYQRIKLGLAVLWMSAVPILSAEGSYPVSGFTVDTTKRSDVVKFYNCAYMASENYAANMNFTGSLASGNPGTTSQIYKDDVLRRVNYYRAMCGLPADITFNPTKSAKCQQAALVMAAHGSIEHTLDPSWPYYTPEAAEAAAKSNLAGGNHGPRAIDAYMIDAGSNNTPVGHRRYILHSRVQEMGTGDFPSVSGSHTAYNVLWVQEDQRPVPVPKFVSWPNSGYVPDRLSPARWSLSYPGAIFTSATVTMTTPQGTPVATTIISNNANYGDNTLVWEPAGIPTSVTSDVSYHVTVSGISGAGIPTSHSYTVTLINPLVLDQFVTIQGSNSPSASGENYTFNSIDYATAYELRVSTASSAAWVEGAEDLPTPNIETNTNYPLRQTTLKRSGSKAFHLAFSSAGPVNPNFVITRDVVPSSSSTLQFYDRGRFATNSTTLHAEISTDNGDSWTSIFSRIGVGFTSSALWDSDWIPRSISLSSYAGKVIRLRFVMKSTGSVVPGSSTDNGFFIDDITVTNAIELINTTKTALSSTSFTLNAQTAGSPLVAGIDYYMSVRPYLSCKYFAYGAYKIVSVDNTAPTPNPASFAIVPSVASRTSITMTATPAVDPNGVEYYFTCTAGGGKDSGWQASNTYTDKGLTPGITYSYKVTVRDLSPAKNTTAASAVESVMLPITEHLMVYEGFDYPVGELLGLNGGIGFASGWSNSAGTSFEGFVRDHTTNLIFDNTTLDWDGVLTNNFPRSPATGSRYLASDAQVNSGVDVKRSLSSNARAMSDENGVLWMSAVYRYPNGGFGASINIGLTDGGHLTDRGRRTSSTTMDFAGVSGWNGSNAWNQQVNPTIIDSTTATNTTWSLFARTAGGVNMSSNVDKIIVLKYTFGASDKVEAFWFNEDTPLASITEAAFNAGKVGVTYAAGIDESKLNTIVYSQGRFNNAVDEIRIGDSFAIVVGQGPPENIAPVASNGSVTTHEDTPVAITLAASDADGTIQSYTVVSAPTKGILSGTAPNLTYTPNANLNGADSFTFTANDGTATSNTATVSITVNAVNDAPVASNGSATTNEDTPVAITLAASDIDSPIQGYSIVSGPSKGTLSGTPPNLTYTPNANSNGADSFTFKVNDATATSNTATVSITVNAVNDAPVASNGSATTNENTPVAITLVATDIDSTIQSYTVVEAPTKGTLSGTAPNLTYTPNANFHGADSFTFTANDGTATSNTATVSITVNEIVGPGFSIIPITSFNPTTFFSGGITAGIDFDVDSSSTTGFQPATQSGFLSVVAGTSKTYNVTHNGITFDIQTANANQGNAFRWRGNSLAGNFINDFQQFYGSHATSGNQVRATVRLTGLSADTNYEVSFFTYNVGAGQSTLSFYEGTSTSDPLITTFTTAGNQNNYSTWVPGITFGLNSGASGTIAVTIQAPESLVGSKWESRLTLNGIRVVAVGAPVASSGSTTTENRSLATTFEASDIDAKTQDNTVVSGPANSAPTWTLDPVITSMAEEGVPFTDQTLAGIAIDADAGDSITYSKVSGPAWLVVAANGTLSGTPGTGSSGINSFVVRATDSTTATADATLKVTVSGLPLSWVTTDIGVGMLAGSISHSAGTFTQAGSGVIGGTSDKLRFTYQMLTGDGEIIARISNLQNTGTSSRVGVMVRESLAANSKQIFMGMASSNSYRWMRRSMVDAIPSASTSGTGAVPNTWVRIARSGTTITSSKSADGITWTTVNTSTNTNFASTCYIGLAVASGSSTTLNTSQFNNVSVTP